MLRPPDTLLTCHCSGRWLKILVFSNQTWRASLPPLFSLFSSLRWSRVSFRNHLVFYCIAAPLGNRSISLVSVRIRYWMDCSPETCFMLTMPAFVLISRPILQSFFANACAEFNTTISHGKTVVISVEVHRHNLASVELCCSQWTGSAIRGQRFTIQTRWNRSLIIAQARSR